MHDNLKIVLEIIMTMIKRYATDTTAIVKYSERTVV